jgi:phospholipid/cholesterol/gamma-HCH transport system ATP-binding protein
MAVVETTVPSPLGLEPHITVRNLDMAYGDFVIQRNLNFTINRADIFIIMGGSGCGKSTLLKHLVGLMAPARGEVLYGQQDFWKADATEQERIMHRFGILYQSGALWSSMTLAENVVLPLGEFTDLNPAEMREIASLKLALVGLAGFEDFYPSEISGACAAPGLARAMALDPKSCSSTSLRRPRSHQLAPPRRPDPGAARQPRCHHRCRHP